MLPYVDYEMRIFSIVIVIFYFNICHANSLGTETGLDLPRYVSLKSNNSNLRVGPSKNYPIAIKYIVSNFPLKIIEEYEDWRRVEDLEKNNGWIHKSLIKGERYGIVVSSDNSKVKLFNVVNGKIVGEINAGALVYISKCKINWCLINIKNHKGWLRKDNIWGVKKEEIFNINIFQEIIDYYMHSINFFEKLN